MLRSSQGSRAFRLRTREQGLPPANKKQAAAAAPPTAFQALAAYLNGPVVKTFLNLREPDATVPEGHVHDSAPGYLGLHQGNKEIWLPNARFEGIAGGEGEANALKTELHAKRLIVSERRGKKLYFSVKRRIPGLDPERQRVVALRLKPRPR